MAHHRGEFIVGLDQLEQPGVDAHLSAREGEGVEVVRFEDHELPFGIRQVATD